MKKKTRQRLLTLVWLLVAVAGLAMWFIPPRYAPPRAVWRAPVGFQVPSISLPDVTLPEAVGDDVKDAVQELVKPEPLPELPYEEEPAAPPKVIPSEPQTTLPLADGQHPLIALIIDDMGLVHSASARAASLPAPVTLSYLPYAPGLQAQVAQAAAKGHEIMLHLPMEPLGRAKPGPGALLTHMDEDEIRAKTLAALDSFEGYRGINNHMGSKFTLDRNRMAAVIDLLRERDLFFLDSRTSPRSIGAELARAAGVPTALRDVFLDDDRSPQAIQAELARLETLARRKGQAIAIGHPHTVTLQALEAWIPAAQAKGYRFVPVSEIVR